VLEVLELYIVHEVLNIEDFVLVLEDIVLDIDNIGYVVLVLEHLFIRLGVTSWLCRSLAVASRHVLILAFSLHMPG